MCEVVHRRREKLKALGRLRRVLFLGVPYAAALASKGRSASSSRITCVALHLPPRAAGMPRSSNPSAMARNDSRAPYNVRSAGGADITANKADSGFDPELT